MKKLIICSVSLIVGLYGFAQDKDHAIEVRGSAKFTRVVDRYIVDILISDDFYNYAYEDKPSFDSLKSSFFRKAKQAGLSETSFKEDKLGYANIQYGAKGTLYRFETASADELIKLHGIANGKLGANAVAKTVRYKPLDNEEQVIENALRDGREKATKIARSINKKLGDIIYVNDYNSADANAEEHYYHKTLGEQYYTLSIKFAME